MPQVLDRQEAEARWSSSSQPPPLLIQPECMFIHPEKAKCLRYVKIKRTSWNQGDNAEANKKNVALGVL